MTTRNRIAIPFLLALLAACPLGAATPTDWTAVAAREAPAWVRSAVIYEVFPRQFSQKGDFASITARLDELKALGIDVLWLMPVHPIGHLRSCLLYTSRCV